MTPRKPAAGRAAARPATVRRPTAAELAATPAAAHDEEAQDAGTGLAVAFDPEIDFDLGAWRDQKAQQTEATRESVKFRLDDRRDDAPDRTYVVDIPLLSGWEGEALRRLEDKTVAGIVESIGMATGDPDVVEVLDKLTGDEIGGVLDHLIAASGVGPGESRPSGASSRRTRRR